MEELTKDMRILSEVIGRDNVIRLMCELGGISVYIPRPGRNEIIAALKENAHDAKMVATILRVSQRKVYDVLNNMRKEQFEKQLEERQMRLF
jgi:hypothetical protein